MLATSSLGELLVADRTDFGLDLDELSRQTGFAVQRLAAVESGRHDLSDDELSRLLDRFASIGSSRRPNRALVEIDLDAGSLRLHRTRRRRSLPAADQNLLHYLSMLHRRHDLELGAEIPLKAVDLSLLRASLALRRDDVSSRLDRMGGAIRPGLVSNRSLLVAAVATGLVVAAGAIVLIPAGRSADSSTGDRPGDPSGDRGPSVGAVEPQIDIGTPLVVERPPTDVPGPSQAETGAPATPQIDTDGAGAGLVTDNGVGFDADVDAGTAAHGVIPAAPIGAAPVVDRPAPASWSTPIVAGSLGPRGPPANDLMISS